MPKNVVESAPHSGVQAARPGSVSPTQGSQLPESQPLLKWNRPRFRKSTIESMTEAVGKNATENGATGS